ncbi:hypothetical protein [Bacillus horti]|uniref:Uncharacterized protein n=1 Tax=Caldalkalibacillus horti TaxID=77523 RepID=A0ABT9W454_9BACI|nr:hypothetical protein [Bacillus horti]
MSGKVRISGFSTATQRVDAIGIQLTLQQWTGSTWIDVYRSRNTSSSSSSNTYEDYEVEVSKGYYYRSISYHWIEQGRIREEGTLTTGSIFIPNN